MRIRSSRSLRALGQHLIDWANEQKPVPEQPLLILHYNPDWFPMPEAGPICGGRGELTYDHARFDEADAVIFHIPTLSLNQSIDKRQGQRWVAASMESDVNFPQLRDAEFMQRFDYTTTYQLGSDFPMLYLPFSPTATLRTPPQPKTEPALAVYMASSSVDRSQRLDYVRELMEYIPVDSYGQSLRNRTFAEDRGRETKLDTIARYKFTLAFENSIAPDYVTEKFFDPLTVGSVPVYLGAPNVADFAPGEHCFINTADYAGPRALADELLRLARDENAYDEYLAWKTQPYTDRFMRLVEHQSIRPVCRLCAVLRG